VRPRLLQHRGEAVAERSELDLLALVDLDLARQHGADEPGKICHGIDDDLCVRREDRRADRCLDMSGGAELSGVGDADRLTLRLTRWAPCSS
jgi:hypothetical protein